jgi:hypothetical protein
MDPVVTSARGSISGAAAATLLARSAVAADFPQVSYKTRSWMTSALKITELILEFLGRYVFNEPRE